MARTRRQQLTRPEGDGVAGTTHPPTKTFQGNRRVSARVRAATQESTTVRPGKKQKTTASGAEELPPPVAAGQTETQEDTATPPAEEATLRDSAPTDKRRRSDDDDVADQAQPVASEVSFGSDSIQGRILAVTKRSHGVQKERLQSIRFQEEEEWTRQLRELKEAQLTKVVFGDQQDDDLQGLPELSKIILGGRNTGLFLGQDKWTEAMYVPNFFEPLLHKVVQSWNDSMYTVSGRWIHILGNAGTGKSWFQVYALKKLLEADGQPLVEPQEGRQPLQLQFVVRQVGVRFYLIDVQACKAYRMKTSTDADVTDLLESLKNTVYFFEPGGNDEQKPLNVDIPSLWTLSPNKFRVKELLKERRCRTLHFEPWKESDLKKIAHEEPSLQLSPDDIVNRFYKFGGIIRHVLAGDIQQALTHQSAHLEHVKYKNLIMLYGAVDRTESGNNVGGHIMCYRPGHEDGELSMVDDKYFENYYFTFTSDFVHEDIRRRLAFERLEENVQVVVKQLGDKNMDPHGMHLEGVGVAWALSRIKFKSCQVEEREQKKQEQEVEFDDYLFPQNCTKMTTLDIAENLRNKNLLLIPIQPNFPVVDCVFSTPNDSETVIALQFSWKSAHPFTISALSSLRKKLRMPDTQRLEIHYVTPLHDMAYAKRSKAMFVYNPKGDKESEETDAKNTETKQTEAKQMQARAEIAEPVKVQATANKAAARVKQLTGRHKTIWHNTDIYVTRPKGTWKQAAEALLKTLKE